jgi:hypothetical protein
MFLTTSERIKNTVDYKKIVDIINRMYITNTLWLGRGQCISMSDIISTALLQVGIKCRIVECQLVIANHALSPQTISPVGYDSMCNDGEIDTHVVVITETEIPMMIDASMGHRLPPDKNVVVDEIAMLSNNIFCDIEKDGIRLTYQQKKNQKIPFQHQISIIERIKTDKKLFDNLSSLKVLVIIALTISLLNASRGFYDFYQKYYNDESLIGKAGNEAVLERLERVEELLKLPQPLRK